MKKLTVLASVALCTFAVLAEEVKVEARWDRKDDEIIKIMPVEDGRAEIDYRNGMKLDVTVRDKDGQAEMDVVVMMRNDEQKYVEHARSTVVADWNKEARIACAKDDSKESLTLTAIRA